jgi:type IV pilus assembly protein PilC
MPCYHVEFADLTGQRSEIALNAPSLPALAQRLQGHGCTLIRVLPVAPDRSVRGYWRRVSEAEAATLLRQLAVTLENGVSVAAALALLAREAHNLTLRAILLDMERSVRSGDSLSSALSGYPRLFSPVHVRLLEAGEAGNRLPEVLRQLAEYAERASQASQRIRASLIYPQVVGVFTLVLMSLTLLFVVPQFLTLFNELGVKELPWATQSLMWASAAILPVGIIGAPLATLAGWLAVRRSERHAAFRLAELRMRIPIMGVLYHNFALLRLTRLLAALLRGGVPLLEALRLAGQGAESPLLQAAMWDAIPNVAARDPRHGIRPRRDPAADVLRADRRRRGRRKPSRRALRLSDWYGERVDYLAARAGALVEPLFHPGAGGAGRLDRALGSFAPLVGIIRSLSGGA